MRIQSTQIARHRSRTAPQSTGTSRAEKKIESFGKALLNGPVDRAALQSIPHKEKTLLTMAKHSGEPLHHLLSGWAQHGTWMAPTERMEKMLESDYGLSRKRSGSLTVKSREGHKTELATVDVLQKTNAKMSDPGVVVVRANPGNLNNDIFCEKWDEYKEARNFHDLFFVEDLSKIKGLQGDSEGNVEQCRERMLGLMESLREAAPVSTHDYYQGFGRGYDSSSATVGANHFRARKDGADYPFAVSAGYYQGVHDVLGLEAERKIVPERLPASKRLEAGLIGAACAGVPALISAAAASISGLPSLSVSTGLAISGIAAAGFGTAGLMASSMAGIEGYDTSIPGSYELADKRLSQAKWMATSAGAGLGLAFGLGCSFGLPGALGIACLGLGAGLLKKS